MGCLIWGAQTQFFCRRQAKASKGNTKPIAIIELFNPALSRERLGLCLPDISEKLQTRSEIRWECRGLEFCWPTACPVGVFLKSFSINFSTHPFVKSLQVDFLFGLDQLLLVVLALDLQLVAHQRSRQVSVARNLNDGNLTFAHTPSITVEDSLVSL